MKVIIMLCVSLMTVFTQTAQIYKALRTLLKRKDKNGSLVSISNSTGEYKVEGSFKVTTGKYSPSGDKTQMDVTVIGPIGVDGVVAARSYTVDHDNILDLDDGKFKVFFYTCSFGLYKIHVLWYGKESELSPLYFKMTANGGDWVDSDGQLMKHGLSVWSFADQKRYDY